MPRKQRIGVCILLCLGFIVTIAGVIRTYFIWKGLMATYDETWYSYPLWIAATVEVDLAVVSDFATGSKGEATNTRADLRMRSSLEVPSKTTTRRYILKTVRQNLILALTKQLSRDANSLFQRPLLGLPSSPQPPMVPNQSNGI
jgi:hypothetical protein